jgi:hypothetical protein
VDQVAREGRFCNAIGSRVALSTNLFALPPKIARTGQCSGVHRNACPDKVRRRALLLYLPFEIKSLAKIAPRLHDLVNKPHVSTLQKSNCSPRVSATLRSLRAVARFCPTAGWRGVLGGCEPHHNGAALAATITLRSNDSPTKCRNGEKDENNSFPKHARARLAGMFDRRYAPKYRRSHGLEQRRGCR